MQLSGETFLQIFCKDANELLKCKRFHKLFCMTAYFSSKTSS